MAILQRENSTTVTDWGAYINSLKQNIMPFEEMVANLDLGLFIVESDMEAPDAGWSSKICIDAARSAGTPLVASYPFFHPGQSSQYAIDRFCAAFDREEPDGVWIDAEEFQYYDVATHQYVKYDSQLISDRLQALWEGLSARNPEILVDIYTRNDYIWSYARPMLKWIDKLTLPWIAAWPDYGLPTEYVSWADIKAGNMRQCTDIGAPEPRPFVRINIFDGQHGPNTSYFPNAKHWLWQSSTRMRALETRGTKYDHQIDMGFANLKLSDLKKALAKQDIPDNGGPEIVTIKMPNKNTPQGKRAWGIRVPEYAAFVQGVTWSDTWCDFFVLPAMRMDKWDAKGEHLTMARVDDFATRAKQIKDQSDANPNISMIVVAEAVLDAGYFPMEGHNAPELQGWDEYSDDMVEAFLRGITLTQDWTYDQLRAKQVVFAPFSSINIRMVETHTYPRTDPSADVGDFWQALTFETFIKHIRVLMANGMMPVVPIALETRGTWLQRYQNNLEQQLVNRHSWLYLHLIQETNKSTATFATVPALFPDTIVPDDFVFSTSYDDMGEPNGYQWPPYFDTRVFMHTFGTKQKTNQIVGQDGKPTEIEVIHYWDDATAMGLFFGNPVPVPPEPPTPPEPPAPEPTTLLSEDLRALLAKVTELRSAETDSVKARHYSIMITQLEDVLGRDVAFIEGNQ